MSDKLNPMRPGEVISGKAGDIYVRIGGNRYHYMHITEIEAVLEYEKGEVPMLGRIMTGHKINGIKGSYKGKGYYRFSEERLAAEAYKNGAGAPIFEIEITNIDESTLAGVQRVVLKDCMPDSVVLAKSEATTEFLEEDIEGTFDDFEIADAFSDEMEGYIES